MRKLSFHHFGFTFSTQLSLTSPLNFLLENPHNFQLIIFVGSKYITRVKLQHSSLRSSTQTSHPRNIYPPPPPTFYLYPVKVISMPRCAILRIRMPLEGHFNSVAPNILSVYSPCSYFDIAVAPTDNTAIDMKEED